MKEMERRIQAMQRSMLVHRIAISVLAIVVVAIVALGQTNYPNDAIRARQLEIVDERGLLLMSLGRGSFGGGGITIFDSDLNPSMILGPNLIGRGQIVIYKPGTPISIVSIGSNDKGDGNISIVSDGGKELLNSTGSEFGNYGITTVTGVLRIDSPHQDDTPLVVLGSNKTGDRGAILVLSSDGTTLGQIPR